LIRRAAGQARKLPGKLPPPNLIFKCRRKGPWPAAAAGFESRFFRNPVAKSGAFLFRPDSSQPDHGANRHGTGKTNARPGHCFWRPILFNTPRKGRKGGPSGPLAPRDEFTGIIPARTREGHGSAVGEAGPQSGANTHVLFPSSLAHFPKRGPILRPGQARRAGFPQKESAAPACMLPGSLGWTHEGGNFAKNRPSAVISAGGIRPHIVRKNSRPASAQGKSHGKKIPPPGSFSNSLVDPTESGPMAREIETGG